MLTVSEISVYWWGVEQSTVCSKVHILVDTEAELNNDRKGPGPDQDSAPKDTPPPVTYFLQSDPTFHRPSV